MRSTASSGRKDGLAAITLVACAMYACAGPAGTDAGTDVSSPDVEAAVDAADEGADVSIDGTSDTPSVLLRTDPEIATLVTMPQPSRILADITTLVGFGTRNACSSQTDGMRGIGAARAWIRDRFAAIAGMRVTIDPYDHLGCAAPAMNGNVVAWLPGTEPDRLIIIGGHYDSIAGTGATAIDGTIDAPGANDSGSQTALLIEAARALAGHMYRATIVFAAFSGEEQSLQGSRHLARNLAMYFPGATVDAVLNCDIVGGDNVANTGSALRQFRLYAPGTPRETGGTAGMEPERQGTTDDTSPARGILRHIGAWTSLYVPEMLMQPHLREDRPGRGSDHEPFLALGMPGVRFIETIENLAHQHSPDDLVRYVTPEYVARMTSVVVATAASLARAPAAPRMIMVRGRSMDAFSLQWMAPPGAGVDHFVVAARPTTSSSYVRRVSIAGSQSMFDVTADALGVSASTAVFISVAAVDEQGHESLFAYPEYRCDPAECLVQLGSEAITLTRNL